MERRHFLKHLAAVSTTSLFSLRLPRICAWAQMEKARPHFFIFVFARGGWDPTMVFEPKVGLETIDVDPDGVVTEVNGITFLDNPNRDWVKTFFTDFGSVSCVINGVDTQSVSHSVGTEIMMTGSAGENAPDWPTVIASEKSPDLLLPYMALSGPSFAGTLGKGTASGSGFVNLLLSGGDVRNQPSATAEMKMDAYVADRFERYLDIAETSGRSGARGEEMAESLARWSELKNVKTELGAAFEDIDGLGGEGVALATAFERGYALTGSLRAPGSWDSHGSNFSRQSSAFQNTFEDLHRIVSHLVSRPATAGSGTLLDQTTVLVMSEMGRTPKLNGSSGKDHWPVTSVLAIGGGVSGGQVVGGTDDLQNAVKVDFSTGQASELGEDLNAVDLGAAILGLAGVDPAGFLPAEVRPFSAFMA